LVVIKNKEKKMKSFNKWWKVWGQVWGFILGIVYLNVYFIVLQSEMQTNKLLAVGWLVSFFGFVVWYSWQMKKHGWNLPKSIKDTH